MRMVCICFLLLMHSNQAEQHVGGCGRILHVCSDSNGGIIHRVKKSGIRNAGFAYRKSFLEAMWFVSVVFYDNVKIMLGFVALFLYLLFSQQNIYQQF